MEIRKIPSGLRLDADVADGLERLRESGESATDLANEVLRNYLKQRQVLPEPQD